MRISSPRDDHRRGFYFTSAFSPLAFTAAVAHLVRISASRSSVFRRRKLAEGGRDVFDKSIDKIRIRGL